MLRNALLLSVLFSAVTAAASAQEAPSGFYTGAGLGYIDQKARLESNGDLPSEFSLSDEDVVFSFFSGYHFKLGRAWFLGTEVGLDINGDSFKLSNSQLNITGRFGRMLGEDVLAYAKASYSHRFVKNFQDFDGYGVGGGSEFRLTDNWWLRTEYTYTDLDSIAFRIFSTEQNISLTSHQVVASAVFRF